MTSYVGIGLGAMGAGIARELYKKYDEWRIERNALPDDVRAEIYWNDQRYERLRWWLVWGAPIAMVTFVGLTFLYFWVTTP